MLAVWAPRPCRSEHRPPHLLGLSPSSLTPVTQAFPKHAKLSLPPSLCPCSSCPTECPRSSFACLALSEPPLAPPPPAPANAASTPTRSLSHHQVCFRSQQLIRCGSVSGFTACLQHSRAGGCVRPVHHNTPPSLQKDPAYSRCSINVCCIQ